ncbi:hypothetical protein FOI42_RS02115 [Escherichia coli]|nr:hypothetical protein [Escherichia coli]EFL4883581.1 hypothetical protein [Escherichia coli]MED6699099.1 hypothetical protein [Escherichia coli O157]USL83727.1 hypothetical protein A4_60 [Escherichia phage A4]HCQ0858884.1 hypothetical protein [Escherichia coli]
MNDIFSIEPGIVYEFVVVGGYKITGSVIAVRDNGMILNDGTHLVQAHVIMFTPKIEE